MALFMATSDLKMCLLFAVVIVILFEGTALMKLWFWVMHSKIATLREIKLLQLAVAELKTQASTGAQTTAPALPDDADESAAASTPTEPSKGRLRRAFLIVAWLLAVPALVYFGWRQTPCPPQDVTTYLERANSAADAAQWQQSFTVTQARQHFYPQLLTGGKPARAWISVAAENHEPMYTGPVDTESIIGFGQAAPGRYVVKGRTEQAGGNFTLRIGGVDEVPGTPSPGQSFLRLFFLMLSAAATVVIPLVWLQNRWIRHIDPEPQRW
jgi:hypothetical protein